MFTQFRGNTLGSLAHTLPVATEPSIYPGLQASLAGGTAQPGHAAPRSSRLRGTQSSEVGSGQTDAGSTGQAVLRSARKAASWPSGPALAREAGPRKGSTPPHPTAPGCDRDGGTGAKGKHGKENCEATENTSFAPEEHARLLLL